MNKRKQTDLHLGTEKLVEEQCTEIPHCETSLVNLDTVHQLQREILPMQEAQQMAEFFSVLADPNRLRLVSALANQELCVCDLAAGLSMGESAVSHQLRILRAMRLVKYRKEGRNVYYSLADHHVINLYREVAEHLNENMPTFRKTSATSTMI